MAAGEGRGILSADHDGSEHRRDCESDQAGRWHPRDRARRYALGGARIPVTGPRRVQVCDLVGPARLKPPLSRAEARRYSCLVAKGHRTNCTQKEMSYEAMVECLRNSLRSSDSCRDAFRFLSVRRGSRSAWRRPACCRRGATWTKPGCTDCE